MGSPRVGLIPSPPPARGFLGFLGFLSFRGGGGGGRLRRRPAKPMGSPRVGSIPAPTPLAVSLVFSVLAVFGVAVGAGG